MSTSLRPPLGPNETYNGQLARTLPELGNRELGAIAQENHWHENPNRWQPVNRHFAILAIVQRAEDAGVPEWIR